MVRFALLASLLTLLAAVRPATARPGHQAKWPFWLSKPERHGSRKLAGDYTSHYGTYRGHSHANGGGLFGFLHGSGYATARHHGPARAHGSSHRRTSGLF